MKILYTVLAAFNRFIENMDIKTIRMIRQLFIMIFFVAGCAALIVGISMGKGAADKGGVPMVDTTRDVFEIYISREKENVSFEDMIDSEKIIEKEKNETTRRILPESHDSPQLESDEIVEKEDPKRDLNPVIADERTPEPMELDDKTIEEKKDLKLPAKSSRDDKKIEFPDNKSLVNERDDKKDYETTKPIPEKSKDDTKDKDAGWKPSGEKKSGDVAPTPLHRDEEIVE